MQEKSFPEHDIPPAPHPRPDCPWCWKKMFPGELFPIGVTSRICAFHQGWMQGQIEQWRKMKENSENRAKC